MNIGIDLDGTITDFHRYLIIKGKKFLESKGIKYGIKKQSAMETEDIFELKDDDLVSLKEYIRTELRMKVKPRKNVIMVLKKLHDMNYKIYIITSRKERDQIDCYNNTKKWLDDNNIYYDKLVLGNSNKVEECLNNNIDIFIDDKIKHCKAALDNGIMALIFDNVYNKKSDIERINSFDMLLDKVKKSGEYNGKNKFV